MAKAMLVLGLILASSAIAQQGQGHDASNIELTVRVCRSQYSSRCPFDSSYKAMTYTPWRTYTAVADCSKTAEELATSMCQMHHPDQTVTNRPYQIVPVDVQKGNRCDITVFDVICYKN